MGSLHRRMGGVLAVALAVVWVATLAFAETGITPAMHCEGSRMPCCPRGSGESCSTARCTEQVPEKVEAKVLRVEEGDGAVSPAFSTEPATTPTARLVERRRTELRCRASVFRLKDDLRI